MTIKFFGKPIGFKSRHHLAADPKMVAIHAPLNFISLGGTERDIILFNPMNADFLYDYFLFTVDDMSAENLLAMICLGQILKGYTPKYLDFFTSTFMGSAATLEVNLTSVTIAPWLGTGIPSAQQMAATYQKLMINMEDIWTRYKVKEAFVPVTSTLLARKRTNLDGKKVPGEYIGVIAAMVDHGFMIPAPFRRLAKR